MVKLILGNIQHPPPSPLRYATPPFQLTLVRINDLQPPPTAPILPTGNVMTGVVVVVVVA